VQHRGTGQRQDNGDDGPGGSASPPIAAPSTDLLRNIALSAPYFHNGRFATLTNALGFYVRRDTNPGEWYRADGNGVVRKFDDLPAQFVANVNRTEVPYNRLPGDPSALDAAEIADVISFLQTLTDGYQP
jgi:cytochrome c peroxidase